MWKVTSGSCGHEPLRIRESKVNQNSVGSRRRQLERERERLGAVRSVERGSTRRSRRRAAAARAAVRLASVRAAVRLVRHFERRSADGCGSVVARRPLDEPRRAPRKAHHASAPRHDARNDARADDDDVALRDRERQRRAPPRFRPSRAARRRVRAAASLRRRSARRAPVPR